MSRAGKNKTRAEAGSNVAGREVQATAQSRILVCDASYISGIVTELYDNGVGLQNNSKESLRENLIGPDGLFHKGVARYALIGAKAEASQLQLPLGSI